MCSYTGHEQSSPDRPSGQDAPEPLTRPHGVPSATADGPLQAARAQAPAGGPARWERRMRSRPRGVRRVPRSSRPGTWLRARPLAIAALSPIVDAPVGDLDFCRRWPGANLLRLLSRRPRRYLRAPTTHIVELRCRPSECPSYSPVFGVGLSQHSHSRSARLPANCITCDDATSMDGALCPVTHFTNAYPKRDIHPRPASRSAVAPTQAEPVACRLLIHSGNGAGGCVRRGTGEPERCLG